MTMCDSGHTQKLRQALAEEKLAAETSMVRYRSLTAKITQFQMGEGPAPTEAEFSQWVADVNRAVELRKLLDGVPDS